ncbi:XRE family transcriptional regulator [Paraburkholderia sp. Cpub6]|uniref:XRE family transcriptional regulator n=1 Tax=Paraburkholderia sp. Cpub6 TaxID=2723094 RepID=UPI001608D9B6|nr:XRE family transcriptional regulator [Paraburkholderia sp. Cpub6]MBB5458693.1 hypothetical protein [Paraburkholderia sp. Cpub6]
MKYTPPTPENLQHLKDELGLSSAQMAELFGLSSGRHWRSYTGGADIRSVSASTLFFAMARLKLSPEAVEIVLDAMRSLGATIDLNAPE